MHDDGKKREMVRWYIYKVGSWRERMEKEKKFEFRKKKNWLEWDPMKFELGLVFIL